MALTIALIALACFAALPAAVWLRAPWHWSELDATAKRRVIRVSIATGVPYAILGGSVAGLCAGLLPGQRWLTIAAPLTLTAGLVTWNLIIAAPLTRLHRLSRELKDSARRDSARARLLTYLESFDASDRTEAKFHTTAATYLTNAGLHTDALRILEAIPGDILDGHAAELRAIGIVAARAVLGDAEGARAAVAHIPSLAPGSIHGLSMENTEARILILERQPERALGSIRVDLDDPDLQRGRLRVRAHALAALDRLADARECLQELRDTYGREAIEAVTRESGPANKLAQAMLLEDAGPYR